MIRFITLLNASYHNWIAQIRAFFFRPFFKHIGKYVLFREGFKFQSAKQISIGHHVFINHGVEIAGAGGVKIGNYILIGPNVRCHRESCVMRERKQTGRDGRQIRSVLVI